MRELIVGPFKSVIRVSALVRKELIQVRRRPGAFLSLVFGPFLIMAIFGLGYTGVRKPLDTVIVIPTNLSLSRDVSFYQGLAGPALTIRAVSVDADTARALLAAQQLDLLIIAPADAEERFHAGQQAQIEVELNAVDPLQAGYAEFIAQVLNNQINEEIIRKAVEEGQSYALGEEPHVTRIPPEVIASPTVVKVTNIAPTQPNVVAYAAPAALALMLQHMAITLTALSFVRERLSGALELFRISPVNALELVLAKYIGLGLVSAVVAVISVLLLVGVLGVPLLGSVWLIAGVITLLVLASLGIGLIISIVSDSERQAVQLAMLLLLASVFFSGFVLPVHEFREGVQYMAYSLPVTHGIRLLQDLMLRGTTAEWWEMTALAGLALVFLILTTVLLRRTLRSA
ncbi:MAG: ABC transporter permease [Chloroflexota bacterium]